MSLHGSQKLVYPWDDEALHETGGSVAQWKYRYRNADGHMEDAPPAMNSHEYKVRLFPFLLYHHAYPSTEKDDETDSSS